MNITDLKESAASEAQWWGFIIGSGAETQGKENYGKRIITIIITVTSEPFQTNPGDMSGRLCLTARNYK
jgi:hypothetical protein